ncbi:MAG: outer membrane beta-barrel protein [Armatimonadetes bacterium]|nr:outer membrane beta-barrel protein [Candidatus Hippobium faecium]
MRRIIMILAALAVLACAVSVSADMIERRDFTITPSVSYNFMLNKDIREDCGSPVGLKIDLDWAASPVALEAGFYQNKKDGIKHQYIPVYAAYRDWMNDNSYWKIAPGWVFSKHDDEKINKFGFELGYGVVAAKNLTAELDYAYWNKFEDKTVHGINLNIGYTF